MKTAEMIVENVCPFTLEPAKNCRLGKTVSGMKQCPFSLENCWGEFKSCSARPLDGYRQKAQLMAGC